jgi:murein DD-endopeptidase MepM/ murein hydrolase activator NlpD
MTQTPSFQPLPPGEKLALHWPTPNHYLFGAPEKFFARTRVNPNYGRPGWTRDCGKRFHRGCDIAPVSPVPAGGTVTVMFSDCEKGVEFPGEEPAFTCDDEVFAVAAGVVAEVNADDGASTAGRFVVIEHRWPSCGEPFFTFYAHLSEMKVAAGDTISAGACLGRMGQTSSSEDARRWMAVAPHLHFEAWNAERDAYHPEDFLRAFLPR